jgi:hypothetical protein
VLIDAQIEGPLSGQTEGEIVRSNTDAAPALAAPQDAVFVRPARPVFRRRRRESRNNQDTNDQQGKCGSSA